MKAPNITKGPWSVVENEDNHHATGYANIKSENPLSRYIARIWPDANNHEANAKLIAAAPTLAEDLNAMLEMYLRLANSGDCGFWNPEEEPQVIAARAALKAAGYTEE